MSIHVKRAGERFTSTITNLSKGLYFVQTTRFRFNPLGAFSDRLSRWPWWALVAALFGVLFGWIILTNQTYSEIFMQIRSGIVVTIRVTVVAYALALVLGLLIALGRVSSNAILYQISTFYVEIVRGMPTLVLLLYIALVLFPLASEGLNTLGAKLIAPSFPAGLSSGPIVLGVQMLIPPRIPNLLLGFGKGLAAVQSRNIDYEIRVIIALTIAYSAFLAEIYRAGIESVDRGQMEAARALGMTYWQAMRHVILRQAIRQVLPPLGNDFIAMLKDSSLVSVLGVFDITRLGTLYNARTFKTLEAYSVVAYLYLVMTLLLSMVVKWIERAMSRERQQKQPGQRDRNM
jgi:polar amino acid transport system permease protein